MQPTEYQSSQPPAAAAIAEQPALWQQLPASLGRAEPASDDLAGRATAGMSSPSLANPPAALSPGAHPISPPDHWHDSAQAQVAATGAASSQHAHGSGSGTDGAGAADVGGSSGNGGCSRDGGSISSGGSDGGSGGGTGSGGGGGSVGRGALGDDALSGSASLSSCSRESGEVQDFEGPVPELLDSQQSHGSAELGSAADDQMMEEDIAEAQLHNAATGKQPRKGSGAWLRARRTQPVAPGFNFSVLQAAYSIAEINQRGASNTVCDMACKHTCNVLKANPDIKDVLHPQTFHMVKEVLGVEDAARYEFGWCAGCGFRHPDCDEANRLRDTACERCGRLVYKV